MNSNILVILITLAVVIVLILIFLNYKKKKDSSWSGTVIDKNIQEIVNQNPNNYGSSFGNQNNKAINISLGGLNQQQAVTHKYLVTIQTTNGQQINWDISSGMYEQISIGDELSKASGTMTPQIIKKSVPTQLSTSYPNPYQTLPPKTPT